MNNPVKCAPVTYYSLCQRKNCVALIAYWHHDEFGNSCFTELMKTRMQMGETINDVYARAYSLWGHLLNTTPTYRAA